MNHSTKLSMTFLLVSIAWIGMTDPLCAALFPEAFPTISLFKSWFFAAAAALAIKLELSAEEWRRAEAESRLQESAIRDPLTGLLNRRAFDSQLEAAVDRARRSGTRLGVAFIDLDNFKAANDLFGHAFGDEVLRAVVTRLRCLLRSADVAARLGGDEFAIVVEPDNGDSVEKLVHRLLAAFREPVDIEGLSYMIALSIGIARYPDHGELAEQLLRSADLAMYQVKREGRSSFAVDPASLNATVFDEGALPADTDLEKKLYGRQNLGRSTHTLFGIGSLGSSQNKEVDHDQGCRLAGRYWLRSLWSWAIRREPCGG